MAILLIRIEDPASLPLNEFYDYNGRVYALSRSRYENSSHCMDLEDFYEASIGVTSLHDIPVVFVTDVKEKLEICGWYRRATVNACSSSPSFFLEGNITAASSDALLLRQEAEQTDNSICDPLLLAAQEELNKTGWILGQLLYEVIEAEDYRHNSLQKLLDGYHGPNYFLRYPYLMVQTDPAAKRNYETCIRYCMQLAGEIMEDRCHDIRSIKLLEAYSRQAVTLNSRSADGYYYLAMASYQLGFIKQGIKAIEKALRIEPDGADLFAQKAYLLISLGYYSEGAACFHSAYVLSGEEDYLLWEGKTSLCAGKIEEAYDIFRRIKDPLLLSNSGINPQDLEKKNSFLRFRGLHLRNPFRRS